MQKKEAKARIGEERENDGGFSATTASERPSLFRVQIQVHKQIALLPLNKEAQMDTCQT